MKTSKFVATMKDWKKMMDFDKKIRRLQAEKDEMNRRQAEERINEEKFAKEEEQRRLKQQWKDEQ